MRAVTATEAVRGLSTRLSLVELPVPNPSLLALVALGLMGLILIRRRK